MSYDPSSAGSQWRTGLWHWSSAINDEREAVTQTPRTVFQAMEITSAKAGDVWVAQEGERERSKVNHTKSLAPSPQSK